MSGAIEDELRVVRALLQVHSETSLELMFYAQPSMAVARETIADTHRLLEKSQKTRAKSGEIRRDPFRQ